MNIAEFHHSTDQRTSKVLKRKKVITFSVINNIYQMIYPPPQFLDNLSHLTDKISSCDSGALLWLETWRSVMVDQVQSSNHGRIERCYYHWASTIAFIIAVLPELAVSQWNRVLVGSWRSLCAPWQPGHSHLLYTPSQSLSSTANLEIILTIPPICS